MLFLSERSLTFFAYISAWSLLHIYLDCVQRNWHSVCIPGIWGSPMPQWLQPIHMGYRALERLQGDQCGLKRELWRRCSNKESQVKQYCSSFNLKYLLARHQKGTFIFCAFFYMAVIYINKNSFHLFDLLEFS